MSIVIVILLVKYSLVTGANCNLGPATVYKHIILNESCCQHSALAPKYLA